MEAEKVMPVSGKQSLQHHDMEDPTTDAHQRVTCKIYWVPPWCRWSATSPPPFTLWLNILFALAGGFTSANLWSVVVPLQKPMFAENVVRCSQMPTPCPLIICGSNILLALYKYTFHLCCSASDLTLIALWLEPS